MEKLLDLYPMPSSWYAEYQDGNFTMRGPTSFPATMARSDVIAAIRRKNPDIDISPRALGAE